MSEKIKYVCDVNCPKCGSLMVVKKRIRIISPSCPADKEETYFVEKGVQVTLSEANNNE